MSRATSLAPPYLVALSRLDEAGWAFEDPDGRVVAANALFCLLLGDGSNPTNLVGAEWAGVARHFAATAADPAAAGEALERCRRGPKSCELRLADGRTVRVEHAPAPQDDGRIGRVWRVRDLAGSQIAELLGAMRVAERADETRRTFLDGISHEVRTPINAIIGMSELVAETTLDEDVRDLVVGVERNARRLMGLMDRLLAFAGERPAVEAPREADFDPIALVDEVAAGLVRDAGPLLLVRRGADVPRVVVGDRAGIESVLTQLVAFALADSPAEVEAGVELAPGGRAARGEEALRFFVRDAVDRRAPGEVERALDRVFWQAAGGAEHTGLGREIVHGIAERVGGEITVEPSAEGTLFALRCALPVQQGPDREELLADRRVLVADPNASRRALHAELCLELGAHIRTAGDPEAIRRVLAESPVDFALVADPLRFSGAPWIRLAAAARLDVDAPDCVWRLGPTPARAELLAAFERCLEPQAPPSAPGHARVLVVEDLPDNAVVVRRFLETAGHRVRIVETGHAALRALRGDAWDVALMDINLPDVDGITVTRHLREFEARSWLGATPVVALTAFATEEMRSAAEGAGLQAFLTKPVDRQRLLDAVARYGRRGPVGLIVDGDPVGRLLLMRRARRRASLRLRWAADAAGARGIVEVEPVSFALVGAVLPDGDGLDLVTDLVAQGVRCALVSDLDDPALREAALSAGCYEMITKPVGADAVARALARLCSETGGLSPIRPRPR